MCFSYVNIHKMPVFLAKDSKIDLIREKHCDQKCWGIRPEFAGSILATIIWIFPNSFPHPGYDGKD